MAKNVVFVLHGIGQYTTGWIDKESCAVPALKEAAEQYAFFEGRSLDSFVEFVPILYDDVFERVLEHWSDLGEGLQAAVPVMPRFAKKVLGYLEAAGDERWELNTGADVALYWGFRLFQQRVVLRVLAQMSAKIAATIHERPEYHVLAHSLGTAVAHDSLHHLGTETWLATLRDASFDDPDGAAAQEEREVYLDSHARFSQLRSNPFNPGNFKFSSVTMLSNVSSLIHPSANPYHSIVRPGTASDRGAYTANYLNVNHRYDPISVVGNFKMPAGWEMCGGVDLKLEHLADEAERVHDAAHYISHPAVHLRLLTQYVDLYSPTADDIAQVDAFASENTIKTAAKQQLVKIAKGEAGPMIALIAKLNALASLV